jgi:hypothetical protein
MRTSPLSEQETLMLGDWVMSRVKRDNPDYRYQSPLHLNLDGQSPSQASRTLRSVGYQLSVGEMMYVIGRRR